MLDYKIYNHDCRSMSELPDESVHCVPTSPPYWGLRKYAGEQELIWGGDPGCGHEWIESVVKHDALRYRPGASCIVGGELNPAIRPGNKVVVGFCSKCGAWRGSFGHEPTPELYIQHSVEILREIRRTLRVDGVVFWNIGDSYGAGGGAQVVQTIDASHGLDGYRHKTPTTKPLDLCMIPQRLAIALQVDGWWVRSWIIWHKPNVKPESVSGWRWERHKVKIKGTTPDWLAKAEAKTGIDDGRFGGNTGFKDEQARFAECPGCPKCKPNEGYVLRRGSWRPTTAHEYILMLTKSESYFCDAEAVREAYTEPLNRWGGPKLKRETGKMIAYREQVGGMGATSLTRAGRPIRPDETGRNRRSVWTFPTVPFPGAHFAVFPEQLPELCIKAATPDYGVCAKCGAPWARVIKHHRPDDYNPSIVDERYAQEASKSGGGDGTNRPLTKIFNDTLGSSVETIGWKPTCQCNTQERVPATVLDPFMGVGSTLKAALKLGRRARGYEIAGEYCEMTRERLNGVKLKLI